MTHADGHTGTAFSDPPPEGGIVTNRQGAIFGIIPVFLVF